MSTATVWNNALVALAVFMLSLQPANPGTGDRFART